MEILELKPSCMDYLWGGNRLREEFGLESDKDIISEGWMLSSRSEAPSFIKNGKYSGMEFSEYLKTDAGKKSVGKNARRDCNFPLLIKLIDAHDNLSIQVHPSDIYAKNHENSLGKTEMWYIIEANEGAEIIYGVDSEMTRAEFEESIAENTLLEKLRHIKVKSGDCFLIPSGTLHAIGKGIVLAEVQENSNITYRVYDYNRRDKNGNSRELHIEKALDVTNLVPVKKKAEPKEYHTKSADITVLQKCDFFTVLKFNIKKDAVLEADEYSFQHILVISGSGKIISKEDFELKAGSSIYIPANYGKYKIIGNLEFILSKI